jgi:hypothetical protein
MVMFVVAIPVLTTAQMEEPATTQQLVENSEDAGDVSFQDRISDRLEGLHDRGLHPKIDWITAGSGLSFGMNVRGNAITGTNFNAEAEAMWSIRGYEKYGLMVGWMGSRRDTMELRAADSSLTSLFTDPDTRSPGTAGYLALWYRHYPQVDFFGVGADALDFRTDFAVSGTTLDAVVQWQRSETLRFSARGGLLDFDVGRGTNDRVPDLANHFTPLTAPGLARQPKYLTAGIAAVADTRNDLELPTQGGLLGAVLWRYTPLGSADTGWTRLALDWREYAAVVTDDHVVALRALASLDFGDGRSQTPFYLLHSLGGTRSLRGFSSYRFRGEALTHTSAEYRLRVARFVELGTFLDAALVANDVSRLFKSPVLASPGIGIRVRTDDQVLFRVDWARSSEGHRLVVFMGPAF